MSEIAEIRKLFQDLIAPDLKSVATDVAALKASNEQQFKAQRESAEQQFTAQRELIDLQLKNLRESMDARFDSLSALEQARYTMVLAQIEAIKRDLAAMEAVQSARHETLLKALDIDKRLERVEARQAATAAV